MSNIYGMIISDLYTKLINIDDQRQAAIQKVDRLLAKIKRHEQENNTEFLLYGMNDLSEQLVEARDAWYISEWNYNYVMNEIKRNSAK